MTAAIPVVVVGGYLGAGKTTLVNHLLRHAGGRRIAVLVNDFGDISIDADLIEADGDGQVMALAGGCICCSFGADLVGTLAAMAARTPAPDVVLIETSGVALPAAVARTARLAQGVALEGIVVLADAAALRRQAADRYVGDTVLQQLQAAHIVLLNKCDAVPADTVAALQPWLRQVAPRAVVLPCTQGAVPADVVLGLQADDAAPGQAPDLGPADARWAGRAWAAAESAAGADSIFVSRVWQVPPGTDPQAVADALAAQAGSVVRAKGLLQDASGATWLLQAAGGDVRLTPWDRPAPADGLGRVQVIALRALFGGRPGLRGSVAAGGHGHRLNAGLQEAFNVQGVGATPRGTRHTTAQPIQCAVPCRPGRSRRGAACAGRCLR